MIGKTRIKKLVMFVFMLGMLTLLGSGASAAGKLLSVNWNHISTIGKQASGSQSCACFALAYARTILDGKIHTWSEYDVNGGSSQYSASALPGKANYYNGFRTSEKEVFVDAYNSINAGRPFCVCVKGSSPRNVSEHWITIIGYENVTSLDSLSASNFLMIDPGFGGKTAPENMGSCGYSLRYVYDGSAKVYSHYYTNAGSVSVTDIDTNPYGFLDAVTSSQGTISVYGWAKDDNAPNQGIGVHFYTVQNGTRKWLGALTANAYRSDVGSHGFSASFTTTLTGSLQVEAYGINVGSNGDNGNVMLSTSPKTVSVPKDTTAPTISDIKISNKSSSGYTISCTVKDNVGVTKVLFPTWTPEIDDQDDLIWYTGTISGNTASCQVKVSDHKGNVNTNYRTDIYVYDAAGNEASARKITYISKGCTHSYTWVTEKAATCYSTGSKYQKCTKCGAKGSTSTIAKIAHSYNTVTTKATVCENGRIAQKCSVCGHTASETTIFYPKTVVLSATQYTYSGKAIKPTVQVIGSNGNTISSSNYTVTYSGDRKNVGSYSVQVTFTGNYSGTVKLSFSIVPKGTSISKVTAKSKGFTVKWKKQKTQTSGYQIQYSTNKEFTSSATKTITGTKKTTLTCKKLSAKKKYYVRIRTWRSVSGKKYYSSWSSAKAVTTKK